VITRPCQRAWLAYFFISIALIGAVGVAVSAPFLGLGRRQRRARMIGERLFQRGVACLLRCQPWLAAQVELGTAREAGRGTLYVSNHRSTLDVFLLLAHVPGVRVLAKRSLRRVPGLGAAMALTRQILVSRQRPEDFQRAMRQVAAALAAGDAVHVFPEMTRCAVGAEATGKFSTAPFQMAIAARARVVPVVIEGTDAAWPKGRFALSFRAPVRVRELAPIDAAGFASARELSGLVRERIDAALRASRAEAPVGARPLAEVGPEAYA
jgi:1-acyl-sn-glycerol-3-phosphate acyltransferase